MLCFAYVVPALRKVTPDSTAIAVIDSSASPAPFGYPPSYIDLLERTNQQLNLWWNPYGVMIGALGVLFAVLAVAAVFVIWRQGADFRQILKRSIDEHRQVLDALLEERFKSIEERLTSAIELETAKLNLIGTEQEKQKAETNRKIEELEQKRAALRDRMSSLGSLEGRLSSEHWAARNPFLEAVLFDRSNMKNWHYSEPYQTCSQCEANFTPKNNTERLPTGVERVKCPHCGSVEG